MTGSTRLLQLLKALSVAGLVFNGIAFVFIFIVAIAYHLAGQETMLGANTWTVLWATASIGMPMFGILYAALKSREYLRDISGSLSKK